MRCARCGEAALADGARFCVGCGAPLPFSVPERVESEGIRDREPGEVAEPVPVPAMDEDLIIRPKRELPTVSLSERGVVIAVVAVVFVVLLVLVVVTW